MLPSVKTFILTREYLNEMHSHLSDSFVTWPVICFDFMLPHSETELGKNLKINLRKYFTLVSKRKEYPTLDNTFNSQNDMINDPI